MRKFLFGSIALFLIVFTIKAQNYQTIKADGEYFYAHEGLAVHVIKIDSTISYNDTVEYYNYPFLRNGADELFQTCFDTAGASWIGKKVIEYPNGKNIYFNKNNDTICIETLAELNNTWRFYKFENGDNIEAKVTNLETLTFLEITDSVKTISFQLKDSLGNNLQSSLNDIELVLSKNFGLINTIDFYEFPYDGSIENHIYPFYETYNLVGASTISAGYKNITAYDIFNYEIGDEFHIEHIYKMCCAYNSCDTICETKTSTIKKVLNKESSNDTLKYTYERYKATGSYINGVFQNAGGVKDTVVEEINLAQYSQLDSLPMIYYRRDFMYHNDLTINYSNINSKVHCNNIFFIKYEYDTCYQMGCCIDPEYCEYFYKGCGGPYYTAAFMDYHSNWLVYYKKGNNEWGTPYDKDSLLTVGINNYKINSFNVKAFPNPVNNTTLNIEVNTNEECYFILYDLLGKEVLKKDFSKDSKINTKNLKGMFLYCIVNQKTKERYCDKLIIQ